MLHKAESTIAIKPQDFIWICLVDVFTEVFGG